MEQEQGPNKAIVAIIVIVLLAAVAGGVAYLMQQNSTQSEVTTSEPEQSNTNTNTSTSPDGNYTDGTYTASGTYQSPGGTEKIKITVKLADGVIISTDANTEAASGTSRQYQNEFINNYKELVVGKNIDDVELSRVAGSSLTSSGFNDALEEIRQDAAA